MQWIRNASGQLLGRVSCSNRMVTVVAVAGDGLSFECFGEVHNLLRLQGSTDAQLAYAQAQAMACIGSLYTSWISRIPCTPPSKALVSAAQLIGRLFQRPEPKINFIAAVDVQ